MTKHSKVEVFLVGDSASGSHITGSMPSPVTLKFFRFLRPITVDCKCSIDVGIFTFYGGENGGEKGKLGIELWGRLWVRR